MWRRALAALLPAALAMGCSLPGQARTFQAGTTTVVDESGLVVAAEEGAPDPGAEERPLVVSPGNLREIAIHWEDSSCVDDWTIRLHEGNALRITIEPGAEAADPCAGSSTDLSVTLRLNVVVNAPDIEVEQLANS
jgi:hypothetical protein